MIASADFVKVADFGNSYFEWFVAYLNHYVFNYAITEQVLSVFVYFFYIMLFLFFFFGFIFINNRK